MWVLALGREDSLEEDMATHSSILEWRNTWTEEWWASVHRVAKSWEATVQHKKHS